MKRFSAAANIAATPDQVWDILVDTEAYPAWDPGMVRVDGTLALGEKVKFFTTFSPEKAFAVKVTTFEPGKKMVLTGGMPLGLFNSVRTHTLQKSAGGHTQFQTEESFSGLLFPLFGKRLPDLNASFAAFVEGLKKRAEATQS